MIHYIFLLLAVIGFTAQFGFTKANEKYVKPTVQTTLIMVAVTTIYGALQFLILSGFSVQVSAVSLMWAVVFACIMIPYYVIGVKVLTMGSLAIYSMFMMLGGMIVPFFYGVLFLKEDLTIGRIAGTVLLSLFIVLQALWPKSGEKQTASPKSKGGFFLLCMLAFFINGMTGVVAKAHAIAPQAVDEISFVVLFCSFTAVLSLIMLLLSGRKAVLAAKQSLHIRPIVVMILLGASSYTGNFMHLKAAAFVPASVQFPLVSGGVIILSALASAWIFKEKVSKVDWISVAGAFAATVLFAF